MAILLPLRLHTVIVIISYTCKECMHISTLSNVTGFSRTPKGHSLGSKALLTRNAISLAQLLVSWLQVCQDLGTAGQAALSTYPYSCTILRARPVSMASVLTSVSLKGKTHINFYFSNYVSSVYSVNLMGQEPFI